MTATNDMAQGGGGTAAALDAAARHLRRALHWPNRLAMAIGAIALVGLMGITAADVALRNLFATVLPGAMELNCVLTILVVLAALALVETEKGHIQVDLVLNALPPPLRRAMTAGALMVTIAIIVITMLRVFAQASYLQVNGIVTPALRLPIWPFVTCAGVFLLLFVVALLSSFAEALAGALRDTGPARFAVLGLWLLATIAILALSLEPQLLPGSPSQLLEGILCIGLCFVLIFLGVHVASGMAVAALLGISLLIGSGASLTSLGTTTVDVASNETWSVVPLFTWMGLIVVASGFADALYKAAYRWIGHLPGGLASASTVACAGLSSIVGDTLSGVYSMGAIALPQMRSYGYDMKLATASIACAATIGVMIPPSLAFIVYGMITQVSIGKLFMAGLIPGILFTVILIGLITLRAMLHPGLAPRGETSSWGDRLRSVRATWPVILLMALILGGLYSGAVDANEAGGLGVFGALVIAGATGRLTAAALSGTIGRTLRLTSTIILIFMFATVFGRFIAVSGLATELADLVQRLALGKYELIGAIMVFYVLIGMFMNSLPALVLTVPLFFPLAVQAGFDPVWFGVLVVIMVEIGVVTPPIGMNVFAIASIAEDVSMYQVFRGVLPFWSAFVALIVLIILFPQICLYLPSKM